VKEEIKKAREEEKRQRDLEIKAERLAKKE
jgi:hypothetical protein